MRASPAPNSGSGASSYTSCSGPPSPWSLTAFMLAPLLTAVHCECSLRPVWIERACGSLPAPRNSYFRKNREGQADMYWEVAGPKRLIDVPQLLDPGYEVLG